jgi:hypothetical protein
MDALSTKRTVMSTRPLKTAIVYDFYLFVQLFVFVLLSLTVGRLVFAVDRLMSRPMLTPWITKILESAAAVIVVKT